ncbi:MAG: hypothetical protein ACYDCK_05435 [Thermoplasmatota archaeon]
MNRALLLALALVVPALFAGCAKPAPTTLLPLPTTPTPSTDAPAYAVGANDTRKAPHPVSFAGVVEKAQFTGVPIHVRATTIQVVNSFDLKTRNATVTFRHADGVVTQAGSSFSFANATLTIAAKHVFNLTGDFNATLDATVLVEHTQTTVYFPLPGPLAREVVLGDRLGSIELVDGLEVASINATFVTGRPAGFTQGTPAHVLLSPGRVEVTGAPLRFLSPASHTVFDVEGTPTFVGAAAAIGLAQTDASIVAEGTELTVVGDQVAFTRVNGSVDGATGALAFSGSAVQIIAAGAPQFEARLVANASPIAIAHGSDAALFLRAAETSRVGSVASAHFTIIDARGFAFEPSKGWLASEDPAELATLQGGTARIADFAPLDLSPGASASIGLDIRAAPDVPPGPHTLTLSLVALNAKATFTIPVTVT